MKSRSAPRPGDRRPLTTTAALVTLLATGTACTATRITGVVPSDWPVGLAAPVAVPLPDGVEPFDRGRVEIQVGENEPVVMPAQCEPAEAIGGTPARAWFIYKADPSDPGSPVSVRFLPDKPKPNNDPYRIRYEDPHVHVAHADGKVLLSYWHGEPDRKNPKRYPLNDFIYPLRGLDGEELIASSPPDHIHHRGIFWAWVRNELRGRPIGDWWIPKNIHVTPGDLEMSRGPLFARFHAQHFWVHQPERKKDGERFVDERVVCRVFQTSNEGRAIDIDLTLDALADGVRIGGQLAKDKGYSGLTVRFGKATDVRIECDHRVIKKSSLNQLRALWVDWTGVFDGPDGKPLDHRSGAALFVHPSHPDCPPLWITREYGPINVSYPGMDMLEIPQGKPLRLRYRIWIHRGNATEGHAPGQYRAYAADWKWKR